MSAPAERGEQPFRCEHPARGVMWRMPSGELRPVRCGRSNHCAYCAWLTAQENVTVVALDARLEHPTIGITLTVRDADFEMPAFRAATEATFKRLRRRVGACEYLGLMEWTTGRRTAGRRPHMHALVKGLDPAASDEVHQLVRETWRESTGGSWVTDCRPLRSAGGAIAYAVGHHHKREQAPPASFGGKRFRPSRGYFAHPGGIKALRAEAREAFRWDGAHRAAAASLLEQGCPEILLDDLVVELADQILDGPRPVLVTVPREVERMRRALASA